LGERRTIVEAFDYERVRLLSSRGTRFPITSTADTRSTGTPPFEEFAHVWLYEEYWIRFAETPAPAAMVRRERQGAAGPLGCA
jgi:hypothetical protein